VKISCHLSFATQSPKPATSAGEGEIQVLGFHIWDLAALESQNLKYQSQNISPGVAYLL